MERELTFTMRNRFKNSNTVNTSVSFQEQTRLTVLTLKTEMTEENVHTLILSRW